MKVQVVNHTSGSIDVHKVGCGDIERERRRLHVNSTWVEDIPAGKTVAAAVVDALNDSFGWSEGDDEPQPWHESDIRILPCCK